MGIRRLSLLLIYVLYCAAIIHGALLDVNDAETCSLLCRYCNASATFTNGQCECNFIGNNDEGAKCVQRIQGETRSIDLDILSDDPTDEERSIRAILKSRRRLRTGDAEKVAQYFMNGGPTAGHSHFVRVFNTTYDSADSAINSFSGTTDESNPENEFRDIPSYLPLSTSTVLGNTYGSPLYMVSETAPSPAMPDVKSYTPILGIANPVFGHPAELHDPLLGSIIHPYGHVSPLHALLRVADIPSQIVNSALAHRYLRYPPMDRGLVGSSSYQSRNNLPTTSFNNIPQACRNNDDSTDNDGPIGSNDSPAVRNNMDEDVGRGIISIPNARSIGPSYYPTLMPHNLNQPYQLLPYEYLVSPYLYNPYQNPLLNTLYPSSYGHPVGAVPPYSQSTSDIMVGSTRNTNSHCTNNVNAGQKKEIPTATDKVLYSNDEKEEKAGNTTKISTSKDEKDGKNKKDGKYN